MANQSTILAGLALSGALALAAPAAAAAPDAIAAIDVAPGDGAVELSIRGSRPPSYTVFKLQDPPRLVIDLAGADVSKVAAPVEVNRGGVLAVTTAQYQDARSAVGRVIVALDGPRRYEVVPRGDAVVVRVLDGAAPAAPPVKLAAAPAAPAPHEKVAAAPTPAPVPAIANAPANSGTPAPPQVAAAAPSEDHVVARRTDRAEIDHPARALTAVRSRPDGLLLATDGGVASVELIELRDPPRLAIDLEGVTRAPRAAAQLRGPFEQARFGRDAGKVRVVLDARGPLPAYRLERVPGGLAIVLGSAAPARTAAKAPAPLRTASKVVSAAPPALPASGAPAPAAAHPAPRARIAEVSFSQAGATDRIEIAGLGPHAVSHPDARTVVLTIDGAELPPRLERSLDTSAYGGPVLMVSSFNQRSTGQVKVVATLRGPASDALAERAGGLSWTFAGAPPPAAIAPQAPAPADAEADAGAPAAGFAGEGPAYALAGAPQRPAYTGRRITLEFHDIEIRNLLRLIADVSKKNMVVADDVSGKVTVSLRNVPWDQALDLVLRSKGLGKEEMGNIIRVAKIEDLAKEQEAAAKAAEALKPLIPLKVRLIPVNFARAGDMAARVKDVLTDRGSVSTDERTNVLIVKDVEEALVRAEGLVRNLDTEVPQVLIESRIVEASNNYNKQLGVQWGGNASAAAATGNPTGLTFPNAIGATGAASQTVSPGSPALPNYAVSLPAAIGDGAGGGVGLVFGSVGGAFNLNLRLSALENVGVIKTVSAPKIATIDNHEATIGQGVSIPFSQVSAAGVNTVFIEAKLELKVTPHVSSDGSILLKIKATNNAPDPQLTGANGQPSISKREAETEVLVRDGETTVIGGIYTRQLSNSVAQVPFFGSIPILGYFFRNTTDTDNHTELLIFITPRILNRQATTVAGARN